NCSSPASAKRPRASAKNTCQRRESLDPYQGAALQNLSGKSSTTKPHNATALLPPPLWGRVGEGGRSYCVSYVTNLHPTPNPSPQGGGEQIKFAASNLMLIDEGPRDPQAILLVSSPIFSIQILTTSPFLRNSPRPAPTPAGVPVRIRSPG